MSEVDVEERESVIMDPEADPLDVAQALSDLFTVSERPVDRVLNALCRASLLQLKVLEQIRDDARRYHMVQED